MGIEGNEEADDFADRGSHLESISPMKITYSDALCKIKTDIINEWQDDYNHDSLSKGIKHYKLQPKVSTKPWFHGLHLNGKAIKILTRLRTNHGLCGTKKFMFNLESSGICDKCDRINDLEHIVLKCEKFRIPRANFEFRNVQSLCELLVKIDMDTYRNIVRFYNSAELDF